MANATLLDAASPKEHHSSFAEPETMAFTRPTLPTGYPVMEPQSPSGRKDPAQELTLAAKDLMIADLNHFGDSLLRNEEMGEKRVSFFVTLVAAVVGGLITLAGNEQSFVYKHLASIASWVLIILLLLGILTYLRIFKRNQQTDEYIATLRYIRNSYITNCRSLKSMNYTVPKPTGNWFAVVPTGGYLETTAILEGMLLYSYLVVSLSIEPLQSLLYATIATIILIIPGIMRRAKRGMK